MPCFANKDERIRTDDSRSMSSSLSIVPILRCPNYCASKAALHHFVLVLREQLKGSKIKIIEIFPPAVQSNFTLYYSQRLVYTNHTELAELHDEKHQPDIPKGSLIGMPLNEFTDEAISGLEKGLEEIPVGQAKQSYSAVEPQRQAIFRKIIEYMKAAGLN